MVGEEDKPLKTIKAMQQGNRVSDIVRVAPLISDEQKKEYTRNYEQIANRKYDVVRIQPKIVELVTMAEKQELSSAEYPFVGPSPPKNARKPDEDSLKKSNDPASRLIVFVAGGVSRTEIAALQNLEKENNSSLHNYVLGSTDVFTPEQFLKLLAHHADGVSASDVSINGGGDEESDGIEEDY